ncbi:hypothetical protein P9046_06265 [Bacillus cereus]|uniref:Uncharacterized protein n=1 Tax=Bacillus thuringiensis YBT-1518 TaxID=529122 RepID=A0A9W3KHI9_BACTU|nr:MULTISPECIES: hypothetical protein [Bacillus]AEA18711.1 hypothetical protein CT43_CH5054 [Bacillus thuringiensis serovar chinensis CT-43]AGG03846.1 hypothetical protein H175_ch5136 [Bacillus thuringiensis serovar thuringiensis str. IS5056]AHA74658.1 hypothetical protein YBT1518_27765 [Bacillus thuringiensis YBT-1518]EEM26117.1 hypothetical protein bthur0002_48920 [Bacillus thuringiensis Bt407]EEM32634.1 hypothetical protein bthur0003_48410 [Bacillus thuringiensis serovar thuringiensis str. 
MGNTEVADKIDKNGFELGEEASLAKYEVGIDIPIPFTNHDLHIGVHPHLDKRVVLLR